MYVRQAIELRVLLLLLLLNLRYTFDGALLKKMEVGCHIAHMQNMKAFRHRTALKTRVKHETARLLSVGLEITVEAPGSSHVVVLVLWST